MHVSVLVTFSTTCLPLLSIRFGEIKNGGTDSILQLDFFLYMSSLILHLAVQFSQNFRPKVKCLRHFLSILVISSFQLRIH